VAINWKKFYQNLPEDAQDILENFSRNDVKLKEQYTKELIDIYDTKNAILRLKNQEHKIRKTFGIWLAKRTRPSKSTDSPPVKKIHISEEDVDKFLKDPEILDNTIKVIQATGVIGEEMPIKITTLTCTGKLVKKKKTTSANAHIESQTGAGKDHFVEAVSEIVFSDDWIKYNSPSPTAISYGQRIELVQTGKELDGTPIIKQITADEKITEDSIIYIEDASEQFLNSSDSKMLLDEPNVNTIRTVKGAQIKLQWKKPVVIITTADTVTENQLIRRLPSIPLNLSKEHTKAITDFQLDDNCNIDADDSEKEYEKLVAKEAYKKLKKVYVDLRNVKELIGEKKPNYSEVIMRTVFPRLLDYIKFSTTLHQYQRKKLGEKDGFPILLATKQDVDVGFEVFNYIYSLKIKEKTIIHYLNDRQKSIYKKLIDNPGEYYTYSEMQTWKESQGVSSPTIRKDIEQIRKHDTDIRIKDGYPEKAGYRKPIQLVTNDKLWV